MGLSGAGGLGGMIGPQMGAGGRMGRGPSPSIC